MPEFPQHKIELVKIVPPLVTGNNVHKAVPWHMIRDQLVHNGGLTFDVHKSTVREGFLEEGER